MKTLTAVLLLAASTASAQCILKPNPETGQLDCTGGPAGPQGPPGAGITTLNTLTALTQTFAVGTAGTDFNIVSGTATHTFNCPSASATIRGCISTSDWSTFNGKESVLTFSAPLQRSANTISIPAATSLVDGYLKAIDFVNFNSKYGSGASPSFVNLTLSGDLTRTGMTDGCASWSGGILVSLGVACGSGTGPGGTSVGKNFTTAQYWVYPYSEHGIASCDAAITVTISGDVETPIRTRCAPGTETVDGQSLVQYDRLVSWNSAQSGRMALTTGGSVTGGSPGGSDGDIQYRLNSSTFGGRSPQGSGTRVQMTTQSSNPAQYTIVIYDANGNIVPNSDSCKIDTAGGIVCGDGTRSSGMTFPELLANGSNQTGIFGRDSQSADIYYCLPTTAPTSGQVLQDSGSTGTTTQGYTCRLLQWATIAGGADLNSSTGDVSTSQIENNAVTSAKMAVVNTRRTCTISIGANNGAVLTDADLGPHDSECLISQPSTVVEIMVRADGGTPSIILGRERAGTVANLVSSALATGSSGARACSKTSATTSLDGATSCAATLQNASLNAGDWIKDVSGTAGGVAKKFTAVVVYTID